MILLNCFWAAFAWIGAKSEPCETASETALPQALHWPESPSFENIFSLLREELNQAWVLAFFLSTWVDEAWLFTAPTSSHSSYSAALHPPSMTGSITPLQLVSSSKSRRLMEDYLLGYGLTCLLQTMVCIFTTCHVRNINPPPHTHTHTEANGLQQRPLSGLNGKKNKQTDRRKQGNRQFLFRIARRVWYPVTQMLKCPPQRDVEELVLRTSSFTRQQEEGETRLKKQEIRDEPKLIY